MSEQWLNILVVEHCSVLAPILNELNGKVLDSALKSDKVVKANLLNYAEGTNSIGIMHRSYNPWNKQMSGNQKWTRLNCYITVPINTGEPDKKNGSSWWETLPAPKTRVSQRK